MKITKPELSEKTKINLKAAILTISIVSVFAFLLLMLLKNPVEFIAIVIMLGIFAFISFLVVKLFIDIKESLIESKNKKEKEAARNAKTN